METKENNKYKPFNLEEAKAGKPICTRVGHKARIICFDAKTLCDYPIIALVENAGNSIYEAICSFSNEGEYRKGNIHNLDLVMPIERLTLSFQELVKTYEDACEIIGEKPIDEQHLIDCGLGKSEIAFMKLKTIFKAANKMNNDWKADYSNSSQYKYYPYFVWRSSGFRYFVSSCTGSGANVGSRLCCGIFDDAEYIGKKFEDLYNDYFG